MKNLYDYSKEELILLYLSTLHNLDIKRIECKRLKKLNKKYDNKNKKRPI